ncbi:MAG: hypothetical protein Barrevirus29_4 [Barrevirus sp.]|uniref:Uncharacterized protein n=1 Tax=Barrevirus sp. TaxID=2487763 RepID=A0A3G4ZTF5_9VIRU|nr:MAG: hypothetical protein Barrevirus29_4 [Barrevirus sp.]
MKKTNAPHYVFFSQKQMNLIGGHAYVNQKGEKVIATEFATTDQPSSAYNDIKCVDKIIYDDHKKGMTFVQPTTKEGKQNIKDRDRRFMIDSMAEEEHAREWEK